MIDRLDPHMEYDEPVVALPHISTWHTEHVASRHWVEKAIAWALVAFGSVASVVFHVLWFTGWFGLHLNEDTLTLAVSLEAIFIGILMLIDGRQKDKASAAQALHFQQTIERIEEKIDTINFPLH